jgi:hypothetical protein
MTGQWHDGTRIQQYQKSVAVTVPRQRSRHRSDSPRSEYIRSHELISIKHQQQLHFSSAPPFSTLTVTLLTDDELIRT